MKRLIGFLCVMLFFSGIGGIANADLWDRGGGLIYDDVLDITWLQDVNYAQTSGYDDDGKMSWGNAVAWADTLVYGGYDDWRLPTTVDGVYVWGFDGTTTGGYNVTTSEMGYMYYVNLGNLGLYSTGGTNPQPGWGLATTVPFTNLQASLYWSGTEYDAGTSLAWFVNFEKGAQSIRVKMDNFHYAWAVHPGDVGASVPEPCTLLLVGSGLAGIMAVMRRRGRIKIG